MLGTPLRRQPQFLPTLSAAAVRYGCTSAIVGGFLYDIARRVQYLYNDGAGSSPNGVMDRITTRQGMAWRNSVNGTDQFYKMGLTDNIIPTGNNCTILWQAYKNSQSGAQGALGNNLAASTQEVNIYLPYSVDLNVYWRWGGETTNTTSLQFAPTAVGADDWWAFVAGDSGRGMEIWQNFKRVASNSGNSARAAGASSLYWGAAVGLTSATEMQSSLFAVFNRALPAAFLASGNYWSIFNPPSRRIVAVPAAAATGKPWQYYAQQRRAA